MPQIMTPQPLVTIFSTPRPFEREFDMLQRNALQSWTRLSPRCEILLFNDEKGTTAQVAAEYKLPCFEIGGRNEFGTPLLDSVFREVRSRAAGQILAHVNTDIILFDDFPARIAQVHAELAGRDFLMIGRRYDLEVSRRIDFTRGDWAGEVREDLRRRGCLHGLSGIDYWVFPARSRFDPPPFAIGRPGMDSWLVYRARMLGMPVVDATEGIQIIHQNHARPQSRTDTFQVEQARNRDLAGGFSCLMSLRDTTHRLTDRGLRPHPFPRSLLVRLAGLRAWREGIGLLRRLRRITGI